MSILEYLTVLVSIVVGLGITDLAESVRYLIHPDQSVRWHWIPLTWSIAALLMVVACWWGFFDFLQAKVWRSPVAFLVVLFTALSLYFLCAFALPDLDWKDDALSFPPEGDEHIDLKAFYFSTSHRQLFFGTAVAFIVLFTTVAHVQHNAGQGGIGRTAWAIVRTSFPFVATYGVLMTTERRWVHALLTIVGLALAVSLLFALTPMLTQEG
ncbi:MAG: hypothetical protein R6T83_04735 [Salinibacter sp.]